MNPSTASKFLPLIISAIIVCLGKPFAMDSTSTSSIAPSLPSSPSDLLDQLDAIGDYPERHRYITQLACAHREDPKLEYLLDGLETTADDADDAEGVYARQTFK